MAAHKFGSGTESMAKTLLLARHAETGPGYRGCFVGSSDVPLAGDGPEQAKRLAALAATYRPEICLCSPLLRARQTALPVAAATGLPIVVDDELREVDFGRWEAKTFGQIRATDPELVRQWAAWREDFAFPDGETLQGFNQRIRKTAEQLTSLEAETVLVISHGGVIRTMLCHLLGLSLRNYLTFDVQPATLSVLTLHDRGAVLNGFNLT
jgi:broad specificity phosphatase PhoE